MTASIESIDVATVGADISFIEAPESRAEMEEIATRVKHPLFVNMLSGGVTSILSVKELEQLGYKIVVSPIESLMVCARAMCEEPSRSLSG